MNMQGTGTAATAHPASGSLLTSQTATIRKSRRTGCPRVSAAVVFIGQVPSSQRPIAPVRSCTELVSHALAVRFCITSGFGSYWGIRGLHRRTVFGVRSQRSHVRDQRADERHMRETWKRRLSHIAEAKVRSMSSALLRKSTMSMRTMTDDKQVGYEPTAQIARAQP